jgi:hypothetical protein
MKVQPSLNKEMPISTYMPGLTDSWYLENILNSHHIHIFSGGALIKICKPQKILPGFSKALTMNLIFGGKI